MKRLTTLVPILAMALAACAGPGLFASEPMGKQLDRVRKQLEDQCRADGTPPFGPSKPGQFETACLMFALKPWEIGDTPESAFAHSIKLPSPHDQSKSVYKAGMSSVEYFRALCNEEAGEWVFRDNATARGILKQRPTPIRKIGYSPLVYYVLEKGEHNDQAPHEKLVQPTLGRYEFLEDVIATKDSNTPNSRFRRYFRLSDKESRRTIVSVQDGNFTRIPYVVDSEIIDSPTSAYAYTSRGIRREKDREHAIEGYELIVYQIKPFETLGFRRSFLRHYFDERTRIYTEPHGDGCPNSKVGPYQFIQSVVKPAAN